MAIRQPFTLTGQRLAPLLGAMLLLCSCAPPPGGAPSTALREQLEQIRRQQQDQAAQMQQMQQYLAQLQQQLMGEDAISAQIQNNLETPLQTEGTAPVTALAPPAAPTGFGAGQEITDLAVSASSYLTAFSNLAAGHMESAESGFAQFLNQFPDHQYAPNARYWLASAQLSLGKTASATENLRRLVVDPAGRDKAPAALLQLAQIYRQQGLTAQADDALEQLRNRYPDSPEAQHFNRSDEPVN